MQIATTPSVNVSQNPGYSEWPAVAVSLPPKTLTLERPAFHGEVTGGLFPPLGDPAPRQPPASVYVVWADKLAPSFHYHVLFSVSHDGGLTFSAPKNLSNSTHWASFPRIAVSGDDVFVVWKRHTMLGGGDGEIFFVRSTDKGATFGSPVNLSNNGADSRPPELEVSGDDVYVLWADSYPNGVGYVSLRRSADRGATFSPTATLATDGRGLYSRPKLAVTGSDVYVVWNEKSGDISLCKSTNNGAAFGAPDNLSNNPAASWYPEISAQGNNVFVGWYDIAPGLQNVSFTRSGNKGASFSPPANVSPNSNNAMNVEVKSSPSDVYVIWDDSSAGLRQAFFTRSTNSGASFQAPLNLSKSAVDISDPKISSDGDELYVSWAVLTGSAGGIPSADLVLAASDDGGGTFSPPTNLTLTPNNRSVSATTVIADGVAYIAWSEGSLTDADILFCTATLYEPPQFVPEGRRIERPLPDLPYKVDLYLPSRPPPPPPGPPPPVKRRFPWR